MKYKAPQGVSGASIGGQEIQLVDGIATEGPGQDFSGLLAHGFTHHYEDAKPAGKAEPEAPAPEPEPEPVPEPAPKEDAKPAGKAKK